MMFRPSQRLRAIRKQLLEMERQYNRQETMETISNHNASSTSHETKQNTAQPETHSDVSISNNEGERFPERSKDNNSSKSFPENEDKPGFVKSNVALMEYTHSTIHPYHSSNECDSGFVEPNNVLMENAKSTFDQYPVHEGHCGAFESDAVLMEDVESVIHQDLIQQSDTLKLSEEIRCAFSYIDNLPSVEDHSIIDENSHPVPSESETLFIENLISEAEGIMTLNGDELTTLENHQPISSLHTTDKLKPMDEVERKKHNDRKRKENHNMIERRRRDNINDKIKELATLLPHTIYPGAKLNKGSILKATVEYIKVLQKNRKKLNALKEKQASEATQYEQLLTRISNIESQMGVLETNRQTNETLNRYSLDEFKDLLECPLKNDFLQKYANVDQNHSGNSASGMPIIKKTNTNSQKQTLPSNSPRRKTKRFPDTANFILDENAQGGYQRKNQVNESSRGCQSKPVNKSSYSKPILSVMYQNQDTEEDSSWNNEDSDQSYSLCSFTNSDEVSDDNLLASSNTKIVHKEAEADERGPIETPSLSRLETLLRKSRLKSN